jgi:hypothetical protein
MVKGERPFGARLSKHWRTRLAQEQLGGTHAAAQVEDGVRETPFGRMGKPADIGNAVALLCADEVTSPERVVRLEC